jgi:regulator of sirC expression with transglutaminase-like and TPR domain
MCEMPQHLFDPPTPLDYFAALVADDQQFSQLEAAVAIAQDMQPQLDIQGVLSEIDGLAARLKQRIAADAPPLQRLRLLNRYFFNELGFAGNINDYYAADNSYLHRVLATRRGIPITLALIYIEIAQQVGLVARGVSFPGHFLIKLKMPQGEVVVDPFNGQSLSRDDLAERIAPYRRRHGLTGDAEVPLGLFLQTATPRAVVARMLRNLKEIHRGAEDWPELLAVMQRLVILLPDDWDERRDRGLVRAELGDDDGAVQDLAAYVEHSPGADDVRAISDRIGELRAAGRPHLH